MLIRLKMLRAVTQAVGAAPDHGTPAEAQTQHAIILVPRDDNGWYKQFGETDGQVWANALQLVSGNAHQPLRRVSS